MKKLLAILFACAVIYSCGDNGGETNNDKPAETTTPTTTTESDASASNHERGLELIGGSDCMACHSIDNKLVGPSYKEVAAKYENNDASIDTLVHKIQKGGMGNWGNIPMTPHPDLSDADARDMVKYILSLKN